MVLKPRFAHGRAGEFGAEFLDEAGVAMVQRASPFPPFPPSISQASMSFAAPIRFDLR